MSTQIFLELGLLIIAATLFGYIARKLRQPLIIGYIVVGVFLGPVFLNLVQDVESFRALSELGILLLLFLAGLELNTRVLKEVGSVSLMAGLAQIVFTFLGGVFVAGFLGFDFVQSVYVSLALTFSSTVIVVKLLSDKHELDSLHGRISIGILLVQDFIVVLTLVVLAGLNTSFDQLHISVAFVLLKAGGLFLVALAFNKLVFARLFHDLARSQDLLFMSALSWCFLLAIAADKLGLSIEIGAVLAGVSLANLPYAHEMAARISPLRDFFLVLFFILLGLGINTTYLLAGLPSIILLSIFVLVGNTVIVVLILRRFNYTMKTCLLTGISIAQISEFSLVLVALGSSLGHIGPEIVSVVTGIGIVTMTVSSYMINYSQQIYEKLKYYLIRFEGLNPSKDAPKIKKSYDLVLVGYNRMGRAMLSGLKAKASLLIVDYDPHWMGQVKHDFLYGDVSNPDIMEKIIQAKPRVLFSTVQEFDENLELLKKAKKASPATKVILRANNSDDVHKFYENGADVVILPSMVAGKEAANTVTDYLNIKREKRKQKK